MTTKKVGSTGRYGAKYGRKIKIRVRDIEAIAKAKHPCPKCQMISVKRVATGVWACSKCGAKFAGGAYAPLSTTDKKVNKPVNVEDFEAEQPKEVKTSEKEEQ
ncbi:MAG: 50S ribosomal protein L37ae [Candidatus Undinarchaeales archaeon]|jgi:large subunit ribosomal protein L37Ae|nr:50S ribosomal protein L37ae [Candidatus Undinarchaeales archaeon]